MLSMQWKQMLAGTLQRVARWTYVLGFLIFLLYVVLAMFRRETPEVVQALATQAASQLIVVMSVHVLARICAHALSS